MLTAKKIKPGKNALWVAYENAPSIVHAEVLLELKKAGLYRHWQTVASKQGHDLKNAKAGLRDIFLKLMPETAEYFGLPSRIKKNKAKATTDGTLTLFN